MRLKKIISALLCATLLLCSVTVIPAFAAEEEAESTAVSAEIMGAYGGAKSIVSMTYDDGHYETAVWMNEMFEKYGLRASHMLIVSRMNIDAATVAKWQKIFEKGYLSPENHSMTHAVLPGTEWSNYELYKQNNTPENYQYELVDSQVLLESLFGQENITFAASNNTLWTEAAEIVMEHYYAMRKGTRGSTTTVQSLDPIEGSDDKGGWYNPYMYGIDNSSLEDNERYVQACIDRGGWFISMTHSVIGDSDDPTKPERFEEFYKFLAEKQAAGDVWVTTFADATRYLRERQNSTVTAYSNDSGLFVRIDMNEMTGDGLPLTESIFNHPLTVKVEVPDTWDLVTYKVAGERRYASAFTEGVVNYAYVDVIPNSDEVELIPTGYYTPTVEPDCVGYVTSGGGFTEGDMIVSARTEKLTVDGNKKVYLKLAVSDYVDSTSAIIPIKTSKAASAVLNLYGVTDKDLAASWSSDTLNPYNAPANDIFGDVTDEAEFIESVEITDADTYLLDVTEFLGEMKAAGAEYATVIISLAESFSSGNLEFTLGTADDVPQGEGSSSDFVPYTYVNDFEDKSGKGGFSTGGIGTNELNSFEVGETEGKLGTTTKAIVWKTTRTYERNFLPGVITDKGEITEADIGSSYRISFWLKAEAKGSFVVWLGNQNTKGVYTGYPADKVATFTVTDETVGKWVKYSHVFTIDASNVAVNQSSGGQDICFAITPMSFGQEKERPCMLYLDDIVSTKLNTGAKSAMIPTDSATLGSSGEGLSVGSSSDSYENIRKAYVTFNSADLKYAISAKLNFKTLASAGQKVTIYAIGGASFGSDITYDTAPGAMPDESVDTSVVFRGVPLYSGILPDGEFALDITELASTLEDGACTFVIVSSEMTETELFNLDFESVKLTAGIDYTADGNVAIADGKMTVSAGSVSFNNAFRPMTDGVEYTVKAVTDPGVTLSVGEATAVAGDDGLALLNVTPDKDCVITLSSDKAFSVYGLTVRSADCSVRIADPELELLLATDYDVSKLDARSSLVLGSDIILKAYIAYTDGIISVRAGDTDYSLADFIKYDMTEYIGDKEYLVFEKTYSFTAIAEEFPVTVTVENDDSRPVDIFYAFSPLGYADKTLSSIEAGSECGVMREMLFSSASLLESAGGDASEIRAVLDRHNCTENIRTLKDERYFTPDTAAVSSVDFDLTDGLTYTVKMADGLSDVSFRMGAAVNIEAENNGDGTYTFTVPYHAAQARITVTAKTADGDEISTSFNLRTLARDTDVFEAVTRLAVYAECVTEYYYKK